MSLKTWKKRLMELEARVEKLEGVKPKPIVRKKRRKVSAR